MTTEFAFTVLTQLRLSHTKGDAQSKHVSTNFRLEAEAPLQQSMYTDKKDLPNKEGSKVVTQVLVQGLIGNIHQSHQKGYRDSAEHLRYIISELEKGFVTADVNISEGTLDQY